MNHAIMRTLAAVLALALLPAGSAIAQKKPKSALDKSALKLIYDMSSYIGERSLTRLTIRGLLRTCRGFLRSKYI